MPPANVDATVLIVDIGKLTSAEQKNKCFFEKARDCCIRILERKIISRPKDFIGILLLGSKKTKNKLAEQCDGQFKHIEVLCDLEPPNWQQLRMLPEKPTSHTGDWFESLIVAGDQLKNNLYGVKVTHKKIVLMTNFQSPANLEGNVAMVIDGLKADKIEVDVIGVDIDCEEKTSEDMELARHFVTETEGVTATFDDAMRYLLFHRNKAVTPMPWNANLSIGPNINIEVSVYCRIRKQAILKPWQRAVKDPVTNKSSTIEAIKQQKEYIDRENEETVPEENVGVGYLYGQTVVPFSEDDQTMLYQSGAKGLSLYGFTNSDNITWQNLSGDGVSYLFGRKGNKKAQETIQCLVKCLDELKLVGVARRVYNNGNAPYMYALFPVIDTDDFICLSLVALCYNEDIKRMAFPQTNIKKYACSDEQVNAFKELIRAMDLTNAYDESYDDREAFPIGETVCPSVQHILDCIAFRAMNPGKPLPPPRDDIMMLFKLPPLIEQRSRGPIEKLKSLFTLTEKEIKVRQDRKVDKNSHVDNNTTVNPEIDDLLSIEVPITKKNDKISIIGTIDPVADFKSLLQNKKMLKDLALEMTDIIESLLYLSADDKKAFDAIQCLREECVQKEPSYYNEWLVKFKKDLMERRKDDILEIMNEKKFNLITKDENISSNVTTEELDERNDLYEVDTIPNSTELTMQSEINDYFDEM